MSVFVIANICINNFLNASLCFYIFWFVFRDYWAIFLECLFASVQIEETILHLAMKNVSQMLYRIIIIGLFADQSQWHYVVDISWLDVFYRFGHCLVKSEWSFKMWYSDSFWNLLLVSFFFFHYHEIELAAIPAAPIRS